MIKLRYGSTNTFFIPGSKGGLLIDTDWAGTLPQFFKAIKSAGLGLPDISYVLVTHYPRQGRESPLLCGFLGSGESVSGRNGAETAAGANG